MKPIRIAVVVAAVGVGLAACSDEFPTRSGMSRPWALFQSALTGTAEVPAVTTTASGSASVTMIPTYRDSSGKVDTNIVRVEVLVSAIDSVTQAHIHAGDALTAGPVMVFVLANVAAGRAPITGTGKVLTQLDITRTTAFSGAFTFDSLLTRIKIGTAYLNVHTRRNPGGEIRGQILPKT